MRLNPERRDKAFSEAATWNQFVASMAVNQSTIKENYAGYHLTAADKTAIAAWPGVTDVLVLAHDWCGDVVANLPVFAKIEAETQKLRLHIIPKDPGNVDIAALYPHADGDLHIPIYVFFDAQGTEKGHLIERTPEFDAKLGGWVRDFWDEHPQWEGRGKEFSTLTPEVKAALLGRLTTERQKVRDLEKASLLALLTDMLG